MSKQVDWTELRQRYLPEPDSLPLPKNIELPVFPRVVTEFMRRMEDPHTEVREIAKIIETDSNLTCDLLRHVNSSAMGRRIKANSVLQALTALGLKRCKLFLLTAAAQSAVRGMKNGLIDIDDFWSVNIERGLFAREVALKIGCDADVAYTGAILQDFLLPAMTQLFHKEYKVYLAERNTRSVSFTEFELARFRCQHSMLGAMCLAKWNFPPELVCAVLLHHLNEDELEANGLLDSPIYAVTASALLNDPLNQEPLGIQRLLAREQLSEQFDLFAISEKVDSEWEDIPGFTGNRAPLIDRLEKHIQLHLQKSMNDSILVDRKVGQYTLEEKIGEGAMGVVYKASHNMMKRPAAVKLIRTEKLTTENTEQFEQEVDATCKLEHPNTVAIYDYGHTPDGSFYYAMELLSGITLKELVEVYGPVSEGRALHIMYQMSGALSEAHALGIMHRDIKPENVMLTTRGRLADLVKVLDFGLAKHCNRENGKKQQGVTGTPLYLSPESISNPNSVDFRTDIYSLGAVAYYLITGQTVFTGNSLVDICLQQVTARPITPSERLKKPVSKDLEDLILKCLQKDPASRPQSLDEVMHCLLECENYHKWDNTKAAAWWCEYRHECALPIDEQYQNEEVDNNFSKTVIAVEMK